MAVILTKKINGTFRSKMKFRTPHLIRFPKEQAEHLKKGPRLSLSALYGDIGTATDWYNVSFRIMFGYEVAKVIYTDEAIVALSEIFQLCLSIFERHLGTQTWKISEQEHETLLTGLDACDQIQDENTRMIMLDASIKVRDYLANLQKEHNERSKSSNHGTSPRDS